jgi:hypothetical protein
MPICRRCEERGRPENFGSDPQCAFSSGTFSVDNWQCATMMALRDVADGETKYHDGLNTTMYNWREGDSSLGAVWFYPIDRDFASFIVMSWYKNRGRTSRAYVMSDDQEPSVLTLVEAETALDEHERIAKPV